MKRNTGGSGTHHGLILALLLPVALLLWPLHASAASSPAGHGGISYPIVYIRCERTDRQVTLKGTVVIDGQRKPASRVMRGADIYDVLPDVSHFFGGFSGPCDLVYRAPSGEERVLYDCSSRSSMEQACAAMDPAVSFDGRRVLFALFEGSLKPYKFRFPAPILDPAAENKKQMFWATLPVKRLAAQQSRLLIVDIDSGRVTTLPHEPKTFDSGPAWLSDGRIAFTSTRGNPYQTLVFGATDSNRRIARIHVMDTNGKNIELTGYHGLGGQQHPFQLLDGRLSYSSWQLFGALPFRTTNGSPGRFGTLANFFHLYSQYPDGSVPFALYGQHRANYTGRFGQNHKAAHFAGQSSDGRVWVTDYYRANNNGLGIIVGFPLPPEGQEGIGPDDKPGIGDIYRPRGMVNLASWATSEDTFARGMPKPAYSDPEYADPLAFAGKLGHPWGAPGNRLLVTWGKGPCSTVASGWILKRPRPPLIDGSGQGVPLNVMTYLGRDNPGCDAGIYEIGTDKTSKHPSDMIRVVDSRKWHELMARPAIPYSEIYGVERPADRPAAHLRAANTDYLPKGTPFGLLGAASVINRETRPLGGLPFEGENQWSLQGTDTVDYEDGEICGMRILGVQPNIRKEWGRLFTPAGERVVILGEFPVRHFTGQGKPVRDSDGDIDSSFLVRFPANMPYLMQTVDCQGRTLNSDQSWQHLAPGEIKVCGGCHVHGKPGKDFGGTIAYRKDYRPVLLGQGTVPLLAGGPPGKPEIRQAEGFGLQIEFDRDILPILRRRCASCHSGSDAAAGLKLDVPGTGKGSTWRCLVADRWQNCVPKALRHKGTGRNGILRRPQLTKYMRFMNSRGSLLYWKAANQRTDNRSDDQYGPKDKAWNDVDFGPDHPTEMTSEELGMLARWIDIGAPGGRGYLLDTTPPTLTLAGDLDNGKLIRLHIGVADIPSGVKAGSLRICLGDDRRCLPTPPLPDEQGIVHVTLPEPLSDRNGEILVEVEDQAGNRTRLTRDLAWLARNYETGEATSERPRIYDMEGSSRFGDKPAK